MKFSIDKINSENCGNSGYCGYDTFNHTFSDEPEIDCIENEEVSPKEFSDNWDKYVYTSVILIQYFINVIIFIE